nr:hypothetical protein LTR18_011450 [Exophiala xenobiotica]
MDLLQMNLFIDNEYVPSSTKKTLTIHNPEEDSLVTDKFQAASERDVDKAVAAAKAAFLGWKHTPNSKRSAMMLKVNLNGTTNLTGQSNRGDASSKLAIVPAVAVGNTYIFKSSEKSPLGVLYLGKFFKEAGFPPDVVNLLSGSGRVGALLASHMGITHYFYGFGFREAGSNCGGQKQFEPCYSRTWWEISGNHNAFIKLNDVLAEPALDSTYLGPLPDKAQFERVMSYLEGAKKDGREVLTGGGRKGDSGRFVGPTILMNPDVTAKVYT